MIRNSEQNITYPIALIMSTSAKKNFESLARDVQASGDSISKILNTRIVTVSELMHYCKIIFKGNKRLYLIIDDSLISKIYSHYIEGACDNYDSSDRQIKRSLCSVVAMLTDGEIAIPIDQELWISMEYDPDNHKKKWEIAQGLIIKTMALIPIKMVLMDGLYAVAEFIKWLKEKNIAFEMRFHANRVVSCKGIKGQIRKHPSFKVNGRNPKRTLKIMWLGIALYATVFRRLMKNGEYSIVYQIANYKAPARVHVQAYGYRWNIEKFFRTAKQKLGLNDCMARNRKAQENHIMNVFLSYIFAQIERVKLKLKNVEMAIKSLKQYDFNQLTQRFHRSGEIFGYA
jgi:hypothetical protein